MEWFNNSSHIQPEDNQVVLLLVEGENYIAIYDLKKKIFRVEGELRETFFRADRNNLYWAQYEDPIQSKTNTMSNLSQSLYNKSINLKAGESQSISFAKNVPINKIFFLLSVRSTAPKTIIMTIWTENRPEISITKHLRIDTFATNFSFNTVENRKDPILSEFNRLNVSVNEDIEFELKIHLVD